MPYWEFLNGFHKREQADAYERRLHKISFTRGFKTRVRKTPNSMTYNYVVEFYERRFTNTTPTRRIKKGKVI